MTQPTARVTDLDGLHVGLLSDDELKLFEQDIADGLAYRSYEGPLAVFGIAKVCVRSASQGGKG